jgi:hypothetical protein
MANWPALRAELRQHPADAFLDPNEIVGSVAAAFSATFGGKAIFLLVACCYQEGSAGRRFQCGPGSGYVPV